MITSLRWNLIVPLMVQRTGETGLFTSECKKKKPVMQHVMLGVKMTIQFTFVLT